MAEIAMGDLVINVPDDRVDVSISMEVTAPSAGEIKLAQKNMFKVAVPSVTISTIGIVGDLPVGLFQDPNHQFLLKAYAAVIFAILAIGIVLLLLSLILPQVPTAVGVGKKLMWVAVALIHIVVGLKMTIHAIY